MQARLSSPLARYQDEGAAGAPGSAIAEALEISRRNLQATLELVSHRDVDEMVEVLCDVRPQVLVLGGRLSGPLARYLASQLHLLRPGVSVVESERTAAAQQLIDLRKGDVLVVFDYRRYQADTIESVRLVSGHGVHVVVFTDPWLSPASAFARQVVVTSVETAGPFDSLVGATAILEAVVAAVLRRLGKRAETRMQNLERLRSSEVLGGQNE